MTSPSEPQVPTCWPPFFDAGTTFKIDRAFSSYNTTDWAYSLLFAGAKTANFNGGQITAGTDGVWHVVLAPADTAPLNPAGAQGQAAYQYVERLTATGGSGEIFDVGRGRIMVNPNLAAATDGSLLSYEEKTLAVIEAKINNRMTADIENYSIAGRSVSRIPLRELFDLRSKLRWIVFRQRNPGQFTVPVPVSFPSIANEPYPADKRFTR